MPSATINYIDQPMFIGCDGNCRKAWGVSSRPRIELSDDPDDFVYLADDELGEAPDDPGTYEGGYGKPPSAEYFPNKWCVRECERCAHSKPGKSQDTLKMVNLTVRLYNQPDRHPEAKS